MFTPARPTVIITLLALCLGPGASLRAANDQKNDNAPRALPAGDARPVLVSSVPPVYPIALRKNGVSGEAVVSFIVTPDGTVADVSVVRATAKEFAAAAEASVKKWKYQPAMKDGVPVATRLEVPVVFAVNEESRGRGIAKPAQHEEPESSGSTSAADIFEARKLDVQPVAIRRAPPKYPFALRRDGVTGEAVVEFLVETDGSVRSATAIEATRKEFGDAAVACVKQWKFKPGRLKGRPVVTRMRVPIVFSMNSN